MPITINSDSDYETIVEDKWKVNVNRRVISQIFRLYI